MFLVAVASPLTGRGHCLICTPADAFKQARIPAKVIAIQVLTLSVEALQGCATRRLFPTDFATILCGQSPATRRRLVGVRPDALLGAAAGRRMSLEQASRASTMSSSVMRQLRPTLRPRKRPARRASISQRSDGAPMRRAAVAVSWDSCSDNKRPPSSRFRLDPGGPLTCDVSISDRAGNHGIRLLDHAKARGTPRSVTTQQVLEHLCPVQHRSRPQLTSSSGGPDAHMCPRWW